GGVALSADPLVVLAVSYVGHGVVSSRDGFVGSRSGAAVVALRDEGQLDDARRARRAAHPEREGGTGGGMGGLDIAHREGAADRRAEAARGDLADAPRAVRDFRVLARRRLAVRQNADALPRCAFGELALQHGGAGEAAFGSAALMVGPEKIRLNDARRRVD